MIKFEFPSILSLIFLTSACLPVAEAGLVTYSDGAAHTLSSPSTDYYLITNRSTFNVLAGGSIAPLPESQRGDTALTSFNGNVNISGGSVTGGASSLPRGYVGSDAIDVVGSSGSTLISGGQVTGGAGISGGTGLFLNGAGPTTITGGSILGGDSVLNAGQGGTGIFFGGGSTLLTITGGTFSGGGSPGPIQIPAPSLFDGGGGNVEVSGGQFLSEIVVSYVNTNSRLDFFGTGLNYSNGMLSGVLGNGDVINQVVNISGASVNTVVVVNSTHTEVSFLPAAVPEPSSILMIALGLGGVALFARSRRG